MVVLAQSRQTSIDDNGYDNLTYISEDLWAWENLKADLVALIAHFFFGLMIVSIIESPLANLCSDYACCTKKQERDDIDLDDDVAKEEERVANMKIDGEYTMKEDKNSMIEVTDVEKQSKQSITNNYDVIRIDKFSKTY